MSEQENTPPSPPRPTIKTSAVPLKKETVRITLRPQVPQGPEPPAEAAPPPAIAATAPVPAPRPPAPTVPLAPPPRPSVPGAPPSGGPPAAPRPAPPTAPVGSKTIPLSQPPARPTTPMTGKQTTRLVGGGAPTTQPLPKATVKLTPSVAPTPASPVSSAIRQTAVIEDDEEVEEGPLNIMGWVALVAGIAALIFVLSCMDDIGFFSEGKTENKQAWLKAGEPEGFKLPMNYSPFDTVDANGNISNPDEYKKQEPDVPIRPDPP